MSGMQAQVSDDDLLREITLIGDFSHKTKTGSDYRSGFHVAALLIGTTG